MTSTGAPVVPPPTTVRDRVRRRVNGLSLNARVALVTVAAVVVAVLVAGAVALPLTRQAAAQDSAANLERIAATTAATIERGGDRNSAVIRGRLAATLRAEDITVFYAPPGSVMPGLLSPEDVQTLQEGRSISGERTFQGNDVLIAARGLSGGGAVVLVQPANATSKLALAALGRYALALAVGVAIAIIFGLLLARRLTRPLRDAAEAAKRLGEGDRDVELPVTGPPEIADLNEAINDLRRALILSEGRQREFLLSVSHELRTPLTAIRGYAEAIADDIVPADRIPSTASTVQAEADRLDLLVSDLLDLARLDAVDLRISAIPVDLGELASSASVVWGDQCRAAGVEFRSEIPVASFGAITDPTRIRQVIDNLCANALRVTPSGGVVVLSVRPGDPGWAILEVRDSGPGLTEGDYEVAFMPGELYNRYRGVRRVGTGVGLALVGRLAARLGGSAAVGPAAEGGARFTITVALDLSDHHA